MKKILIDEDRVATLAELAKELAGMYGWTSYRVEGDTIYFEIAGGTAPRRVDVSGFAQELKDGEWVGAPGWNIDWSDIFDGWANYVWAEDEDGNAVMIHD